MSIRHIAAKPRLFVLIACLVLSWQTTMASSEIRVGIPRFLPPFAFVDEDGRGVRGFSVDLAMLLAAEMRKQVKFYPMSYPDMRKALREGRIDFIGCIAEKEAEDSEFSYIQTGINIQRQYFAYKDCITVTCNKDLPGHTVAFVAGSRHLDVDVTRNDITFIQTETPMEALALVNSGNAHVFIAYCALSTHYLIQKYHLENIKQVGFPVESVALALMVRRNNPEFLTNLSVAFGRVLEKQDYERIRGKWLGTGIELLSWKKFMKPLAWGGGAILFGALSLLVWNRMLRRRVNAITSDLLTSERKYRDLIESSPEMICLVCREGEIALANRLMIRNLGYTEDETILMTLYELVSQSRQTEIEVFLNAIFRNGYARAELVFKANNGNTIPVEVIGTMVDTAKGEKNLACCFARDISERLRLEEELIQSERLATIGRIAAGIAHEINNPLGIILANAQDALHGGISPQEIRQSLEAIERNSERAGKIIENLLSYTRPTPFTPVPVDLGALIEESLFIMKQPLKQKWVEVKKAISDEPLMIQADCTQIQQLLVNLLLNSIEAIPDGGLITLYTWRTNSGGVEEVHFEIEDSGIGIPEAELPYIFDPFFTARKKKGFGLGLFISKRIVEKHGGTIIASSVPGKGTVMKVVFPL